MTTGRKPYELTDEELYACSAGGTTDDREIATAAARKARDWQRERDADIADQHNSVEGIAQSIAAAIRKELE